jgi:hypothetical protein
MDRPLQPDDIQRLRDYLRPGNTDRSNNNPSSQETGKSEKPPIDIAKELEQRGFGNTLKQLVERAKEEAKKPRQPQQNPADGQEIAGNSDAAPSDIEKAIKDATGAAKKADPELSDSVAKMLDGLKDDLVEIAKDAKFNDPPERSRGDRSVNRPSPGESNSIIDTFRKSASEILAGPSRSSNSGSPGASSVSSAASNAFSGEFDFTPVLVLAGVLAAMETRLQNYSSLVHHSSLLTSIVEPTWFARFMNLRCGLHSLYSRGGRIALCNRPFWRKLRNIEQPLKRWPTRMSRLATFLSNRNSPLNNWNQLVLLCSNVLASPNADVFVGGMTEPRQPL